MERCRALEDLELSYGSNLAEFEYLVICLWLPLYDEEKIALPLPVKEVYAVDLQVRILFPQHQKAIQRPIASSNPDKPVMSPDTPKPLNT